MTKVELKHVLKVLGRINEPDANVMKAIWIVNKKLSEYDARRGQLKDQYDYDRGPW